MLVNPEQHLFYSLVKFQRALRVILCFYFVISYIFEAKNQMLYRPIQSIFKCFTISGHQKTNFKSKKNSGIRAFSKNTYFLKREIYYMHRFTANFHEFFSIAEYLPKTLILPNFLQKKRADLKNVLYSEWL